MIGKMKLVFEDAGESKILFGIVEFLDNGFVQVNTDDGKTFLIRKEKVTFIRTV